MRKRQKYSASCERKKKRSCETAIVLMGMRSFQALKMLIKKR